MSCINNLTADQISDIMSLIDIWQHKWIEKINAIGENPICLKVAVRDLKIRLSGMDKEFVYETNQQCN